MKREYVILDIETSHYTPDKGGMIIEVGAVIIDENGRELGRFNELINPERKISGDITRLTGIKNEDLEGKRTYHKVLPELYCFIGDRIIIGHNVQFDWDRFLLYFFNKLGIYPTNETLDTLTLSKNAFPSEKKYNLSYLCTKLGIIHNDKHRAMGDVLATKELFMELKSRINIDAFINKKGASSQISLLNFNLTENNSPQVISTQTDTIRNISLWKKEVKNKKFRRIYVTLDHGVVFYDLDRCAWEVKNALGYVNFKEIEKAVLKKYKLENIKEIQRLF